MRSQFTQNGFDWIPWSQIGGVGNLQRGDILLNEVQHTEIYLGNNQNVGAHSNRGYPQTGDQTGTEVSVSGYYNHPWDGVLRYRVNNNFPGAEDTSYAVPYSEYATHRCDTYNSSGNKESDHYIAEGDYCYIDAVYENGFCHVEYDIPSGRRWAYAWAGDFNIPKKASPSNVRSDKNQYWYDLGDTITIWAYADDATDFEMVIDDAVGNRIVNFAKMDGNTFSIPVSQLGSVGDYYYCIIAKNSSGGTQSEWNTLSVVGTPSYSDIRVSKSNYMVKDTVEISVDTVCAKGQTIGIDKEGVGRVITENCNSTYSIPASQLGVGNYSAYFTVYNGSGGIDTKRVEFNIIVDIGTKFYATIKNTKYDDYLTKIAYTNNIYLQNKNNSSGQVWYFERQEDGAYAISSCFDGKYLEMTNGVRENKTQISAHDDYWGGYYQQWYLIPCEDGYRLQSKHFTSEGWYLDRSANEGSNGNIVQIYEKFWSPDDQVWTISKEEAVIDLGDHFYSTISNTKNGGYVSKVDNSDNIYLQNNNNSSKQVWYFERQEDGAYAISSCYDGKYLEMTNGVRENKTQISAQGDYWGGYYQQWYLIPCEDGYRLQSKHFTSE